MTNQATYLMTAAVTTAGILGGAYCAYRVYQEAQRVKLPEKWTQVGTLKELFAYPIKSCGGIMLNKAECTLMGLKHGWLRDRFLMIVDDTYNFVTARAFPQLLTIETSIEDSILTLKYRDMETIQINLAEVISQKKTHKAVVWRVTVPIFDCGDQVSEWFSRLMGKLNKTYRLVYYASQHGREVENAMHKYYKFTSRDMGAMTDESTFHMINEASVDDLNSRLERKVSGRLFRPNFLYRGAKAFEEDDYKFVKIGENVFQVVMPCTRCLITAIDPETGTKNVDSEPLPTLRSYRQVLDPKAAKLAGTSPRMGILLSLRSRPGGVISVNDPIYVA